jgi:hypothetical protein
MLKYVHSHQLFFFRMFILYTHFTSFLPTHTNMQVFTHTHTVSSSHCWYEDLCVNPYTLVCVVVCCVCAMFACMYVSVCLHEGCVCVGGGIWVFRVEFGGFRVELGNSTRPPFFSFSAMLFATCSPSTIFMLRERARARARDGASEREKEIGRERGRSAAFQMRNTHRSILKEGPRYIGIDTQSVASVLA